MADKKKRGEAGKSNAENIPFRYGQNNAQHSPGIPRPEPRVGSAWDKPIKYAD